MIMRWKRFMDSSLNHNTWVGKRNESNAIGGAAGKVPGEHALAIVNHFKSVPCWTTTDYERNINSRDNLIAHINNFYDAHRRTPNTISCDFVGTGATREALRHLEGLGPDYYRSKDTGWLVGSSVDYDSERSFRIPAGYRLVGMTVKNQGGYGIIDIKFCYVHPSDPGNQTWSDYLFRTGEKAEEKTSLVSGTVNQIEVCKHKKYGIVNIRIHSGDKWEPYLTDNESEDAEIRGAGNISESIWKIAARSEGGHGIVDLKYYFELEADTASREALQAGTRR